MLSHILVPLDGSALSEKALDHVRDIAAPKAQITLLIIIELPVAYDYAMVDIPLTMLSPDAISEDESQAAFDRAETYLQRIADDLRQDDYQVYTLSDAGDPAEIIVETVQRVDADAIVMSTHGRTGINRWLFGSVTQKVLSRTPCPVYVVPGVERPTHTDKTNDEPSSKETPAV